MIDSLKNGIHEVLNWILGLIIDLAYICSSLSAHASSIPVVGTLMANLFTNMQAVFNEVGLDLIHFDEYLQDVLDFLGGLANNVSELLGDIPDWISAELTMFFSAVSQLWEDVYGWISEKVDYTYTALVGTMQQVAELGSQVFDMVAEVFTNIPNALSAVWDYITDITSSVKDEILQIIGPVYNLVDFFFQDISDFFSDPAEYFSRKVDESAPSFAERLWDVIEKILERIW